MSAELTVGQACFTALMKVSERMDAEIEAAKNKVGTATKYAFYISPKAWAGDWNSSDTGDAHAWFMGARAFEIEMRDKLISMFDKGSLKGFPMHKFTG